jgi:putative peptidoglycan lipid II flippase
MLKITFPYLAFISLTGLAGAILNTLNKFAVAAFTPVLLNVCIIGCAWILSPMLEQPAYALAWGVFLGGVVQFSFQLPFLYRAGLLVKPQWGWHDPAVIKVRKLMIPALFGVSVGQINLLFDTFIASFLVTGSISWLYYADRLLEFPLGLFGIAIATVILPTLSRNHVSQDPQAFAQNMEWAIRMICLLGIPAAAGLYTLALPIITVIFQRGAFSSETAVMASYALMAYSMGLLWFMLVKVLAPGFYARQDTKTPVRFGIWCMVANMIFNLFFAIPFGYVGLAIATSLSAALNALLLYGALHRQGVFRLSQNSVRFILQVLCATLGMVVVLMWHFNREQFLESAFSGQLVSLIFALVIAVLSFVGFGLLFGVRPRHLFARG